MIATGGTALAALTMLTEWGLTQNQIKMVSVVGSAQGVKHIAEEFPDVEIFIGAVDDELTEKGYISPGLGDAVSEKTRPRGHSNHILSRSESVSLLNSPLTVSPLSLPSPSLCFPVPA
jgi:hypothetical protein